MHPTDNEIAQIYQLWKDAFSFDDGGFTDDFFKRNFRCEYSYVMRFDGVIVACLYAYPHTMSIQDKQLPIQFISGVITKKEYRHRGYMKKLFLDVFDAHEKDCALFVLQAYNPDIYTSLGFSNRYFHYTYHITEAVKQHKSIVPVDKAEDLKHVSDLFLSNYDGFLLRDVAYYDNYIKEAAAQQMLLYGIYKQDILQGFALLSQTEATIDEIMYVDDDVRDALIAYAQTICGTIKVHSVVPLDIANGTRYEALMVRLHTSTIIKNILQRDVRTLEEVYQFCKMPLYHYGFW